MTAPASHGYPDWGRSISAADIEVLAGTTVITASPTTIGPFFVGNFTYLYAELLTAVNAAQFEFIWRPSETSPFSVARRAVTSLPAIEADGTLPNLGPWVEIEVSVAATPTTVTHRVWQTMSRGARRTTVGGGGIFAVDGTAVGGGVTRTDNAPAVRWGWGWWSARLEDAVGGRMRLLTVDYLGNTNLLAYWGNGDGPVATPILLPSHPIRSEVFNGDGGPHPFYLSLYPHSHGE